MSWRRHSLGRNVSSLFLLGKKLESTISMGCQHSAPSAKSQLNERIKAGQTHHVELINHEGKCLTASNLHFSSDPGSSKLNQYKVQHVVGGESITLRDHHEKLLEVAGEGGVQNRLVEDAVTPYMHSLLFKIEETPEKKVAFCNANGYLCCKDGKLSVSKERYEFVIQEYF